MDRITCVQLYVNRLIDTISDPEQHRVACIHLYGVSGAAALLALQRGVSPEIAAVCGLLHDISKFATGQDAHHAGRSAAMARSCLRGSQMYTPEEIDASCSAIAHHSAKDNTHAPLDEVLKDADLLQRHLHYPSRELTDVRRSRLIRIKQEISMESSLPSSD